MHWCVYSIKYVPMRYVIECMGAICHRTHQYVYIRKYTLVQNVIERTGAWVAYTHLEKKLYKNLHSPNFSSYMDHPLKPLLSIAKVFFQKLSYFLTLKTSTKTPATPCFPCSAFNVPNFLTWSILSWACCMI